MRIYRIVFGLITIFISLNGNSQNITGKIVDENSRPVEFANLVLLAEKDSVFITGTISNEEGHFVLNTDEGLKGNYLIRISSVGYKTLCQLVQPGDIGIYNMESDAQMLGEVVVKGDLPITRLKGDALVTNIEGSVLAKAGTAQDMLNYIPGVASQKGSLTVLGRGTPVVYINGRLMRNATELEQLSSDNIKSVEVVTNPGARYDASVKAVIRILTKKTVGDGFGFSNRAYASYNRDWDFVEQLNLNYRQGGLDVFGMLFLYQGYWYQKLEIIQDAHRERHWRQIMKGEGETKDQNLITNFGASYAFNENHSMGFRYEFERVPKHDTESRFDAVIENGYLSGKSQSRSMAQKRLSKHTVNLYYTGNVGGWDIDFNTDLLWMNEPYGQKVEELIERPANSYYAPTALTTTDTDNRLYASKLVLSHSLWGGNFDIGGEFSHTGRNIDYRNNYHPDPYKEENEIKEDNIAAFAEYSREFGQLQLQAGARYERVTFDYFQDGVRQDEQSKKYDNFFPSVSIAMPIGDVQVRLGYMQDISRPSFHALRSNVFYANYFMYETGNPFLSPSIAHNISFTGVYRWWQLYTSYQRRKDDMMFTMVEYSELNPDISLIKPINADAYDVAYVQLSASPAIGKWWSPRFVLAAQKQWFKVDTPDGKVDMDTPLLSFRWQNSLQLPAGFLFNLDGSWQNKHNSENSRYTKVSWAVDASLHKGFFDDRLTFQLDGQDLFLTRRGDRKDYYSKVYTMERNEKPNSRSVSFTVRYRFNQGKDKYKGSGAGEEQKNRL